MDERFLLASASCHNYVTLNWFICKPRNYNGPRKYMSCENYLAIATI